MPCVSTNHLPQKVILKFNRWDRSINGLNRLSHGSVTMQRLRSFSKPAAIAITLEWVIKARWINWLHTSDKPIKFESDETDWRLGTQIEAFRNLSIKFDRSSYWERAWITQEFVLPLCITIAAAHEDVEW